VILVPGRACTADDAHLREELRADHDHRLLGDRHPVGFEQSPNPHEGSRYLNVYRDGAVAV
jgi:hypothetical protein